MTTREEAILWLNSFVKNKEPMTLIPKQLIRLMHEALTEQPEVVRCKDCKWGDWSRNGKGEKMILCYNGDTGIEDGYLHEPDWFCAEGERL